jgi:cobalt-zinc-cadmium efflux system outer membrane protein
MKTKFKNSIVLIICLAAAIAPAKAQRLSLDSVIAKVSSNPSLLAYDARINAENMYATGAKNLDAP